jgi:predicted TIM-barrel enzyme
MHKLSLARTAVPERTLVVGGGVDDSNVTSMLERADRVIVGNYLQDQARVGRVDLDRAQRLLEAARGR